MMLTSLGSARHPTMHVSMASMFSVRDARAASKTTMSWSTSLTKHCKSPREAQPRQPLSHPQGPPPLWRSSPGISQPAMPKSRRSPEAGAPGVALLYVQGVLGGSLPQ